MTPESPTEGYIVDRDMYHYDSDTSMVSLHYSDSDTSVGVQNLSPEVDCGGPL